jgi:hypothetical protein
MKIKQIKLLSFGVLTTDEELKVYHEDSLTGYLLYPSKIGFIEETDRIEGAVGIRFGIEYFIEGFTAEEGVGVSFTCKILHPLMTNPETGKSTDVTLEKKHNCLNDTNFDYFCFEHDWEIQKGTWVFQILENEVIKLEKAFEIC